MRISPANLSYAVRHPLRALRYALHRDRISYEEIASHLPTAPVIIEAGVANGVNTEEMAHFWSGAVIHGFEPIPKAREMALSRTRNFADRVFIHPYALGDSSSKLSMHVSGTGEAADTQSSSLLKPTGHLEEYNFVEFKDMLEVDVVTLDDWALQAGVSQVDFMWLDLQGYELKALQGATNLLKSVKVMHIEVSHRPLFENGVLFPELSQWLRSQGFKPCVDATFRLGGNVLFART